MGTKAKLPSPLCNDRGVSKIAEHHLELIKDKVSDLPQGVPGDSGHLEPTSWTASSLTALTCDSGGESTSASF